MDNSKLYIKMCEKASQVQKLARDIFKPDIYVRWYDPKNGKIDHAVIRDISDILPEYIILFTDLQLFYLLNSPDLPVKILQRLMGIWRWEMGYWELFQTYEQLWLAFLMKKKFHLVWNAINDEWVMISE